MWGRRNSISDSRSTACEIITGRPTVGEWESEAIAWMSPSFAISSSTGDAGPSATWAAVACISAPASII